MFGCVFGEKDVQLRGGIMEVVEGIKTSREQHKMEIRG